ncbi:MAG: hypothetical protein MI799_18400 [Desulfobacterales bacterium]|nr:hypothetical protein [Desulfobacterales bacterium]
MRVDYSLAEGSGSSFAASVIGNLKQWPDKDTRIRESNNILPVIERPGIAYKE